MAATNTKRVKKVELLAGGAGPAGANQTVLAELRRLALTCMLWENNAYIDGVKIADRIKELAHEISAPELAGLAIECRYEQKLRHVPLLLCRELVRHKDRDVVRLQEILSKVITRADQLTEFLSLYWADNGSRKTLSAGIKKALAKAFGQFNEYALSKYDRASKKVRLRDVLFLSHAKPANSEQAMLWKRLINNELTTPDTWEVSLTKAHSASEKRAVWERLISEGKLGASAYLKNLRNFNDVAVDQKIVREGLRKLNISRLWPLDFLKAAKHAPQYQRELEELMYSSAKHFPRLAGHTIFVVDVSGSMNNPMSGKSTFDRMDAAAAMAVLASEMCESISVYATAGCDFRRVHSTQWVKPLRGFALSDEIRRLGGVLGSGGIFTRQCLDYIRSDKNNGGQPDRIIVFSDSQDCDIPQSGRPSPFGKYNYIVDVSSHRFGINYKGAWTAELSGWSEQLLRYISLAESKVFN